ncbi:hypothetical protein [Streptomyces rimosus]|uniref:hypothetical protein n=1 Tax=Streptomyces rimosus TaxID=1927 RepID=UPI0037A1523F
MRVRVVAALGLTAVTVLALPACSTNTTEAKPASTPSTQSKKSAGPGRNAAPLSSAALEERLLDVSDLGAGYARKPERPARHDDVTVLGCPALNGLGGDAAVGGSLDFPRRAKVTFTYGGSGSEVSEELYSDSAGKLSNGANRIFEAMTGCPKYQVLVGGTAVDIATQKVVSARVGDERWSQLMTFSAGGHDTVVKQAAVRDASTLVVVSGSPALVDQHLGQALAKATAIR